MGENARKALYMAVGVFFSLIIITMGITYYNKTRPVMDNSSSKIDTISSQLDSIDYKSYDGTTVSGSEVISCINTKASANITVKVKTNNNSNGKSYNSGSYNIKDIHDSNYIESTVNFDAEVKKTENGTVTGIEFEQV
ncbi:hypothetical protein FDA33_10455 [Clostridium botulinum]|uniref:Uncharacterized protein n=1 Tax=Clostridium botulinum TaxID=1491 RepID=A0A126JHW1_CLOBO|nr:hypothetical protein [Clostridium botulinum]ALT05290.1 hypothetical protein [Clostridium botulinum]ALT05427.1 hypothetical protein [Clostridium botulinum]ALT05525.1 hypothetical protein [Clostridium botulinum]ALT05623.1 hypothetical protein [Clostridium botulinum]ALT05723.1 hypothetical protein [Clostridium botulinum]